MTAKTNGATFKAFYQDEDWWRGYYHDDACIEVDGLAYSDEPGAERSLDWLGNLAGLEDDAKVRILYGFVQPESDSSDLKKLALGTEAIDLATFFHRWKCAREQVVVSIRVDANQANEARRVIRQALKTAGISAGKVE